MLKVTDIQTFYGESQALFSVSLDVEEGEVVTLLGRNGMGKTTTISSIMGITPVSSGDITFNGVSLRGQPSFRIARLGLGLVPEGRQIFPNLTVRENLLATANSRISNQGSRFSSRRVSGHGGSDHRGSDHRGSVRGNHQGEIWTLQKVLDMFPILNDRYDFMGNLLSGGEQQMLAIARALMTNPSLLLLDDATEGLAPLVRNDIWYCIEYLKSRGLSIIVVDKNVNDLLRIANRHYVLGQGRVVWQGTSNELAADQTLQQRYLGL